MGHRQQAERGSGHLLLFPFLAQGHLIPFLNQAKRLESLSGQRRLVITIASTPRNVASLRRALPAGSSIGFAELPFSPSDHGLPPEAESADAVPLHAFPTFFIATELLRPSFDTLLAELAGREGRRNVCVFADVFLGWTAESARALGVHHRMFLTSGAYASAVVFSIWLHPPPFPRTAGPDDELPLADFPDVRVRYAEFLNVIVREDYANDPMLAYLCRMVTLHFRHSGGIVVNTSEEIEPKGLPGGFQGVVVHGWAPQVRILAHASTGAFLSHCGWNSVLESLWHGVPVVCWPLIADQLFDCRVLLELGVGVEVASGRMVGVLGSEGWERVRDAVETVLGDGDKAREMRRKAAEVKKMVRAAVGAADGDGKGTGSSVLAMERLLDSAFD